MSDIVLQVAGVSKRFGGLQALSEVGITIRKGQVYGLIGPNGAGKTTFFNVITGLYTPDSGSFDLGGAPYKPITSLTSCSISKMVRPSLRMRSISSRSTTFSVAFMPAAGSSNAMSLGSVASARAISRRRWSP